MVSLFFCIPIAIEWRDEQNKKNLRAERNCFSMMMNIKPNDKYAWTQVTDF